MKNKLRELMEVHKMINKLHNYPEAKQAVKKVSEVLRNK